MSKSRLNSRLLSGAAISTLLLALSATPGVAQSEPSDGTAEDSAAVTFEVAQAEGEAEAQDSDVEDAGEVANEEVEVLVVTGTRVEGRSPIETSSPIDVFDNDSLIRQGTVDLTDQLRNISPSFNTQRFPIADGTSFIRPANLRNLPPDQTLVLVNGARRHRSALVNLQVEPFGTVNQGAQSVDFGIIPAIAIKRVEVLRDGASAQYGSDAIAGVINVILRDNAEGLTVTSRYGQMYEGDGEAFQLGANLGVTVGGSGFANISAEFISSEPTSRGTPRADAAVVGDFVGNDLVPFGGLGQRWGDPDVEGYRMFINSEIPVAGNMTFYGHGSFADQDVESSFFYRTPVGVPGVAPRATLFVDADNNGLPDPVDQDIVDDILDQGLDPNDYLTPGPGPSGFVALNPIHTQFPGGYTPTFGAEISDHAGVLGLRGEIGSGVLSDLRWDVSGRFAENQITYVLNNSINPGLGINSPTTFQPGQLSQRELGLNADFVKQFDFGLSSPLNFAFGGEYRTETYEIGEGDPESFEFGPTGILFGVGSDGFQGDTPEAAGEFSRESYAGYYDLEADVTPWLTLGHAGRYESFTDAGTSFDWKVSARVDATNWFALRGTVSTGFRAPTPGQVNTLDVTTTSDDQGNLVPLGTFPVNSEAAIALGATPLVPETSFNVTAGVVVTPWSNVNLMVDFYQIEVSDRIGLTSITILPGSPEQQALIDAGVEGAELLGQVSFFTNAVDQTVRGVDIVATSQWELGQYGVLDLDLRHSYHEQEVDRVLEGTLSAERIFDLENQLPNHRTILTGVYKPLPAWNVLVRANRFGSWEDFTFGEFAEFSAEWLIDLEVSWQITDYFNFAAGAQNIADNRPDPETNGVLRFLGATSPISSPFGINGGFWYVRGTATF